MNLKQKEKVWVLPDTDPTAEEAICAISESTHLSNICARIVYNRGHKTPDEAVKFLGTDVNILHDPFLLKDIDKAVERILSAVESGQKITIYGDYDVDGVTSVTVIYLYLKSIGGKVDYYIPSREKEGYGLSKSAIDKLKSEGTQLIITVDTGITANEEVLYAQKSGIDMVVTDHHECHAELPHAIAVVNPHRPDCSYPFCELAGVGVVFKLVCACEICRTEKQNVQLSVKKIVDEFIDLVAIGTVSDVMPLIDENRYIVKIGLEKIEKTKRCGLSALIDEMSAASSNAHPTTVEAPRRKRKVNAGFIGFGIAPRINAAGRISSAQKAVELLLSETYAEAKERAAELCEINSRRQIEENRIAEQAYKIIEQTHDFENDKVIVISDDNWQQGIIGIVSSRVTEKYGLPSILISFDGATRGYPSFDDIGKGSGRSIKGMNLVAALSHCEDLLVRYGGHELAAGLTVMRSNIDEFRKKINEYAKNCISEEQVNTVRHEADVEISMSDVTMELALEINKMEPFGVANTTPVFLMNDLTIQRIISMGAGKHTKLVLFDGVNTLQAIYFGMPVSKLGFVKGEMIDLLCQININEFQNVRSVQLLIQDIRASKSQEPILTEARMNYEQIIKGNMVVIHREDIPDRDDVIDVYRMIRKECSNGDITMSDRMLLYMIKDYSFREYNLVKLKLIVSVLKQIGVLKIDMLDYESYSFGKYDHSVKTNLEKSELYRRLISEKR